jgi:hypothetical protein
MSVVISNLGGSLSGSSQVSDGRGLHLGILPLLVFFAALLRQGHLG